LEARWAVFFDAAGITWEYEPEGYKTSAGWYLPDFKLSKNPLLNPGIYEIKPALPTDSEKEKCFGIGGKMIVGRPWIKFGEHGTIEHFEYCVLERISGEHFENAYSMKVFAQCRYCEETIELYPGPLFSGKPLLLPGEAPIYQEFSVGEGWGYCGTTDRCRDKDGEPYMGAEVLKDAYIAARSARFGNSNGISS